MIAPNRHEPGTSPASPSRREFLITAAATAAAAGLGGQAFARPVGGKSGKEPIIVGTGALQYEVIHDWGQLPKNISYGNCHGVCEDAQGNIYIKHTVNAGSESKDAMVVFDADGKFVRSWGAEYSLAGGAHGLHLNKEGSQEFLYLCDAGKGIVYKTDLAGKLVWKREAPMDSGLYNNQGEYHATNVAIFGDTLFVSDGYGKNWIHIYNLAGNYKRSFGGTGKDRGQLACPHGLMVDTRGPEPLLAVADRSNRRIQYFTLDGRHVKFVTDEMKLPCHFHQQGELLLVPDLDARVTILDKNNKPVAVLCDGGSQALRAEPRDKFIPGKFITPHSAIFDHAGNIFVVEWVEVGRVTKLRKV